MSDKTITATAPAIFECAVRGLKFTNDWSVLSPDTLSRVLTYGMQRIMNDNAGRFVGAKDGYNRNGKIDQPLFDQAVRDAQAKVWQSLLEGDTASLGVADRSIGAAIRAVALDLFASQGRKTKEDRIAIRKDPRAFFTAWATPVATAKAKAANRPDTDIPDMIEGAWAKLVQGPADELFATWQKNAEASAAVASMFD